MKPLAMLKMISLFLVILSLFLSPQAGAALSETSPVFQAESAFNFCITDVPVTGTFPEVKINFRVFDQGLNPVDPISDKDLRVSENGLVPIPFDSVTKNSSQTVGIDYYILIDRGNRTDQDQVMLFLNSFIANMYDETRDSAQIFTDEENLTTQLYPSPAFSKLSQAVANFPTVKVGSPRLADNAMRSIMDNIDGSFNTCQKPRILFLLVGDNAISENLAADISVRAKRSFTKIFLYHTANPYDKAYNSRGYYEKMAVDAGGQYIQIISGGDTARLVSEAVAAYRQSYSGVYRTNNGASGSHDISFVYKGENILAKGSTSYTINLLAPQASLIVPSIIERTAKQSIDTGYVYDKTSQTVSVNVAFPDGFPRAVSPVGTLVISSAESGEVRSSIMLVPTSGDIYQFNWDLAEIGDNVRKDLVIKVELSDETGLSFKSQDVPVAVLNHIPLNLMWERYLVYIMLGIVLLLLIALLLMRRRMGTLMTRGRDAFTSVVDVIRKTEIFGRQSKALAVIRVVDGPPAMINQELKIFTESVKLGRDPQKADMTFHSPDTKSSVSGLHARIEKVNGNWQITAVSQSGSETFVDEVPIAFNTPYPLRSGQKIRLGYHAQQPVVFIFNTEVGTMNVDDGLSTGSYDVRKTEIVNEPAKVVKISAEKKDVVRHHSKAETDSFFDEFRDR